MTKKQRLVEKIRKFLEERGATESNKLEHDIYLLRPRYGDDNRAWYGELETLWLGKDGTPMCHIWYWGTGGDEPVGNLTYTNLEFVHEYLVKGYVVQ